MTDSTKHLLLVEDEPALRTAVAEQLTDRGFTVEQADSGEAALAKLADFAFDAIVTDLRMPGISGSELVDAAIERYPDIVAIVVTGYGTVKDAVAAIKRGGADGPPDRVKCWTSACSMRVMTVFPMATP